MRTKRNIRERKKKKKIRGGGVRQTDRPDLSEGVFERIGTITGEDKKKTRRGGMRKQKKCCAVSSRGGEEGATADFPGAAIKP